VFGLPIFMRSSEKRATASGNGSADAAPVPGGEGKSGRAWLGGYLKLPQSFRIGREACDAECGIRRTRSVRLTPQHSLHEIAGGERRWLVACHPGGVVVVDRWQHGIESQRKPLAAEVTAKDRGRTVRVPAGTTRRGDRR
jgi:hypothetical protein